VFIVADRVLCRDLKGLQHRLNRVPYAINVAIIWCRPMLYSAVAVEAVAGCLQETASGGRAPIATALAISGDLGLSWLKDY